MQVAIYATDEKRRRAGFDHVLVLARLGEALILRRDRINALWVLPEGQMRRGQSAEEAARSALGEAIGEEIDESELSDEATIGELWRFIRDKAENAEL